MPTVPRPTRTGNSNRTTIRTIAPATLRLYFFAPDFFLADFFAPDFLGA
ncbi:MAG: hypothetical protein RL413_67, partial [Actinomycetota bacterium]